MICKLADLAMQTSKIIIWSVFDFFDHWQSVGGMLYVGLAPTLIVINIYFLDFWADLGRVRASIRIFSNDTILTFYGVIKKGSEEK